MAALNSLVFLLTAVFWPVVLTDRNLQVGLTIVMFILLIFVWHYNTSDLISFWNGLTIVSGATQRGCSKVWMVIALPTLASVFLLACLFTVIGILRGRESTQLLWAALIGRFAQNHLP